MKCFYSFVLSAVDARRKGDEYPHSSVVAETMKLLAKYHYQITDKSQHSYITYITYITKYLNDEKTHKAINSKFFRKLNHQNDNLYAIESVKGDVEHKDPSLWDFSSYSMQVSECLSCNKIYSKISVILTPSKKWKWIQTLST